MTEHTRVIHFTFDCPFCKAPCMVVTDPPDTVQELLHEMPACEVFMKNDPDEYMLMVGKTPGIQFVQRKPN